MKLQNFMPSFSEKKPRHIQILRKAMLLFTQIITHTSEEDATAGYLHTVVWQDTNIWSTIPYRFFYLLDNFFMNLTNFWDIRENEQ